MSTSIPVLYNHQGIAVVDKRFGLASQPTRGNEANLFSLLKNQFSYVGLHHRLDTPASGLILVTTTRRHNQAVAQMFKHRTIQRFYKIAVVGETLEKGTWSTALDGKEAQTTWERVGYQNGYTILEAQLHTGRKHQIRRHAADAGKPILGDKRYGGMAGKLSRRLVLHAHKMTFVHPQTKESITVHSPIPKDLLSFLQIA